MCANEPSDLLTAAHPTPLLVGPPPTRLDSYSFGVLCAWVGLGELSRGKGAPGVLRACGTCWAIKVRRVESHVAMSTLRTRRGRSRVRGPRRRENGTTCLRVQTTARLRSRAANAPLPCPAPACPAGADQRLEGVPVRVPGCRHDAARYEEAGLAAVVATPCSLCSHAHHPRSILSSDRRFVHPFVLNARLPHRDVAGPALDPSGPPPPPADPHPRELPPRDSPAAPTHAAIKKPGRLTCGARECQVQ